MRRTRGRGRAKMAAIAASYGRRWYGEKRRTSASFVSPVNSHRRVSFVSSLPSLFSLCSSFSPLRTACFRKRALVRPLRASASLARSLAFEPSPLAWPRFDRRHRAHVIARDQRSLFYAAGYPENHRKILHLYVYRITMLAPPISPFVSTSRRPFLASSFHSRASANNSLAFQIRFDLSPAWFFVCFGLEAS